MNIPDINLYDQELLDYYIQAQSLAHSSDSLRPSTQAPLWRIYSNGRLKATSPLDAWYASSPAICEPVAWVEWLLYHKHPRKKRIKEVLPLIEDYLHLLGPRDERDRMIWAINYLYASALADIVSDNERKFIYSREYYRIKNAAKITPDTMHLAMLAEIAPYGSTVDISTLSGFDFCMGVKALEKYQGFPEARAETMRHLYDALDKRPDPLLGIALMIENVVGVQYSAEKKSIDWMVPDLEHMGILGLRIGKNTISLGAVKTSRGWKISVNSDLLSYFTIEAKGYRRRSYPVSHCPYSFFLDKD